MEQENIEESFEKAAKFIRTQADKLSSDKLLLLYGLFKQASEGPNKTPKPNFWNLTAKQKWEAWSAQGEKSTISAMEEYISMVTEIDPSWQQQSSGGWVRHSILCNTDEPLLESQKDIFHWVKENDVDLVKKAVENGVPLNITDDLGMTPLHWAADRGYSPIIDMLIRAGVALDVQDSDGQTALHFASSCGHIPIIDALLNAGAVGSIADVDGCTPRDVAATTEVLQVFDKFFS